MNEDKRLNKKVLFIIGAGHSGSTLLGMILGANPKCFYSGEANKIKFLGTQNGEKENRYCKICGSNCPIWSDFNLPENYDLYEYLSLKTSKSNIIDSTKKISWINQRVDEVSKTSAKIYLIYLMRDGRAVVNSRIRKYPKMNVDQLISDWIDQINKTNELFENFSGKKIKLRYEELATEPERVIKSLCEFLKLSYNPKMLRYYEFEHHPLGGNTGTQSLVVKAQKKMIPNPHVELTKRNKYYYETHPLNIKLDLRWKKEMPENALNLFQNMAGTLNNEFMW
ncbi:MAG: hypothetical protein BAJALOKI2v1_100053 [Promethearchaeota archaeon]|nr:MAG: hypothetical protein BAJALOKI2v1_100053 [Candidatus Lokiarchaeota archaeon]